MAPGFSGESEATRFFVWCWVKKILLTTYPKLKFSMVTNEIMKIQKTHVSVVVITQVQPGLGGPDGLQELSTASSLGTSSDLTGSTSTLSSGDEKIARIAKQLEDLRTAMNTSKPVKPQEKMTSTGDVAKTAVCQSLRVGDVPAPQQKPLLALPTGDNVASVVRALKSNAIASTSPKPTEPKAVDAPNTSKTAPKQENMYVLPSFVS